MSLFLTEADVRATLTMPAAIEAVRRAFVEMGSGRASNAPRVRHRTPEGVLMTMSAAVPVLGYMGVKTYTAYRGAGARFYTWLYDATTGRLVATIEANLLGQIRTGAASGVATEAFARREASVLGLIGAGGQAATQLEAVATVRRLADVRVYSRTPERREAFATAMRERFDLPVRAVDSPAEAVRRADIVSTITNSREPVFDGNDLAEGTHVNAAGNNQRERREIDTTTIRRATLIAADQVATAQIECGELIAAVREGIVSWDQVHDLGVLLARGEARPVTAGISLFESQGVAFEDVAVGALVYEAARERGLGTELPV